MRTHISLVCAALALGGCGGSTTTPGGTAQDAATQQDVAVTPDVQVTPDAAPAADVPAARTYPAGPYGSSVCRRLEPFSLNKCDGSQWQFQNDGWSDAAATVVIISAGWCVPCQMEAGQIERELGPYVARGVRVVTVLVQDPNHTAITPTFCGTWTSRYHLTIPVLMDPAQILQPYYPGLAFPGNLIVDARGVIRYRAYGTMTGLSSIKTALDDVLSNPNTCTP